MILREGKLYYLGEKVSKIMKFLKKRMGKILVHKRVSV